MAQGSGLIPMEFCGWDFEIPGSPPVTLSNIFSPNPNCILAQDIHSLEIKNTATGKVVFYLTGRFAKPVDVQWDGRYLVAG